MSSSPSILSDGTRRKRADFLSQGRLRAAYPLVLLKIRVLMDGSSVFLCDGHHRSVYQLLRKIHLKRLRIIHRGMGSDANVTVPT